MRPKLAVAVLALTALLTTLAACSKAGDPGTPASPRTPEVAGDSFLFITTAGSGTASAEDPSQKMFTLTLKDPDPVVVFLSERPKRLVGHVPLQVFVQGWNLMGFGSQPPPAAAIISDPSARDSTVTIELGRPSWNEATKSLSFQARIAQTDRSADAAFTSPMAEGRLPASFGHVSLIIDPTRSQAIEFAVTPNGVIELRQRYAQGGNHPIAVIPEVSYVGPNYFGRPDTAAATPGAGARTSGFGAR